MITYDKNSFSGFAMTNKKVSYHRPQLPQASICGQLVKNFLTPGLITMQNLVVSHTVCVHVGGPKNFGTLVLHP